MSEAQHVTPALELPDEVATHALGAALARAIEAEQHAIRAHGLIIFLAGELGSGKTALVRAMLRALGVTGPIKSPTYALVEPYVVSNLDFYHFDLYRIANADDIVSAGFRELFGPTRICVVEWPERGASRLPTADLVVTLRVGESDTRRATLHANTEVGAACVRHVIDDCNILGRDAAGCSPAPPAR